MTKKQSVVAQSKRSHDDKLDRLGAIITSPFCTFRGEQCVAIRSLLCWIERCCDVVMSDMSCRMQIHQYSSPRRLLLVLSHSHHITRLMNKLTINKWVKEGFADNHCMVNTWQNIHGKLTTFTSSYLSKRKENCKTILNDRIHDFD